jgi:hypothetical protein
LDELVVGPGADAGVLVGGYIGGDNVAERRLDRLAASERAAALGSVTSAAIAGDGEIAPALDLAEILPAVTGKSGSNKGRKQ